MFFFPKVFACIISKLNLQLPFISFLSEQDIWCCCFVFTESTVFFQEYIGYETDQHYFM